MVLDLAVDVARHKFPSSLNSPVSPIKKPEIVSLFLLDATWSFRLVAASANHYLAHVANNRLKSSDRVKPVFDRDQCCNYRPCQPDFTIEGEACSPFYESRCKRSPRYFSKNWTTRIRFDFFTCSLAIERDDIRKFESNFFAYSFLKLFVRCALIFVCVE